MCRFGASWCAAATIDCRRRLIRHGDDERSGTGQAGVLQDLGVGRIPEQRRDTGCPEPVGYAGIALDDQARHLEASQQLRDVTADAAPADDRHVIAERIRLAGRGRPVAVDPCPQRRALQPPLDRVNRAEHERVDRDRHERAGQDQRVLRRGRAARARARPGRR